MKTRIIRIAALVMAVCMLVSFAGCKKNEGEWISERTYYAYDANGNWVEVPDKSYFDSLTLGGNSGTAADGTGGSNTTGGTLVDSSSLPVLIDYMGNDEYKYVFEKSNITIDSYAGDLLEDDYRFRRYDKGSAFVTYKVEEGIAEFAIKYMSGAADRYWPEFKFLVSKDNANWTEVKAQDTTYGYTNGTSWITYASYFALPNAENKYLKIYWGEGGKEIYDPSLNMIQINGLTEEALADMGCVNSSLPAKTIYIDSKNGSDKNDGSSESKALKTLHAASKKVYSPGSMILLKSGCEFSGSLVINGTGKSGAPILVTSYGKGEKPVINTRGVGITSYGEYMTFSNLKFTGPNGSKGINVCALNGAAHAISVTNCDFYDLNSNFNTTAHSSGGIVLDAVGRIPTYFDGVKIENNTFNNVARGAFVITSDWTNRKKDQAWGNKNDMEKGEYFPNINVVVRGNKLDSVGGDAILLFGCEGALVEKNIARNTGLLKNKGEIHWVTMWGYGCTNCVFQYNEVYDNSGRNNGYDLQAFDADISNKGLIFQYNYTENNEGGAMLFCTNDASNGCAIYDNVYRYNVSVNDGTSKMAIIDITSSCYDSKIYNNTFYMGRDVPFISFNNYSLSEGNNHSKNTLIANNILYAKSGVKVKNIYNYLVSATFKNNVLFNVEPFTSGSGIGNDALGTVTVENNYTYDPLLKEAGASGGNHATMGAKYAPKSGSPVLTGGIKIDNNGGKDYFGNPVSDNLIGAIAK